MKKIISVFIASLIIISTFSSVAFYAKEPLSVVETKENFNGYYSVEFKINEPDEWVYLTGLSASQVSYIAQKVADLGPGQRLEDDLFIDAEKLNDDQSNLCWAAAASNILYYTGWSKNDKVDFETLYDYTDTQTGNIVDYKENQALLKYYEENFTNDGGLVSLGIDWFVSGRYDLDIYGNPQNFAQIENGSTGGGLKKEYAPFTICDSRMLISYEQSTVSNDFPSMISSLKNSYGISLGVNFFPPEDFTTSLGAHAVTFWGYTYHKNLAITLPGYFTSFIITDSDDAMLYSGSALPDQLPNQISRVGVEWNSDIGGYISKTYAFGAVSVFTDYTSLLPLGMIKDTASTVVTTSKKGFDLTDGEISLLEAMCFAEKGVSDVYRHIPCSNA